MIDIEWDTPVGYTSAVLGDMLVRCSVFDEIGGFNGRIIAAEDDDFCLRIKQSGREVYRLDASMSRHDADIRTVSQWYKRSIRGGHGYANIYQIHGGGPEKYFQRNLFSAIFWGGVIPLLFVALLAAWPVMAGLLLLAYIGMIFRLTFRMLSRNFSVMTSLVYALLMYTGKVPELIGAVRYWKNTLFSNQHRLIEYK